MPSRRARWQQSRPRCSESRWTCCWPRERARLTSSIWALVVPERRRKRLLQSRSRNQTRISPTSHRSEDDRSYYYMAGNKKSNERGLLSIGHHETSPCLGVTILGKSSHPSRHTKHSIYHSTLPQLFDLKSKQNICGAFVVSLQPLHVEFVSKHHPAWPSTIPTPTATP